MRDGRPQLAAQTRTVLGKKVRFLRREGWTPGNIYGHGVESTAIQLNTREIEHVLGHVPRNSLLSLEVQGATPATVLVKTVSRKPTTDELYHIDFYQVSMTEKLRTTVPIILTGTAPAVESFDAVILHALDSLNIECLPGDLPNRISVDLSRLVAIDDSIFVRDLDLPSGVTPMVGEDDLVVKALAPTIEAVEEGEAEEAAEGEAPEAEAAAEEAGEAGGEAEER